MKAKETQLERRDVLRRGGVAAGVLAVGGAAMTGSSAAKGKRAVAYARETNETDLTEGTVYRLRNKIGPKSVRCNQPPSEDGHNGIFFRAGIDGERGSARVLVQSDSLGPLTTPVEVKVTQVIGECSQSDFSRIQIQRV